MEIYEKFMEINGHSWKFQKNMEIQRSFWKLMEIHGKSMEI
jgi:hypothetical protein